MDGRRNNGGHSTKGKAGRKPKADEIKMIESMDKALVPQDAWNRLASLVKQGEVQAIKLWLAYRFGQPKQQVNLDGGSMIQVVLPEKKEGEEE